MEQIMALVLAAGEGRRMKSRKSKMIHVICGKAMIQWVYDSVEGAGIKDSIIVVGQKAEQIIDCMGDKVRYVLQEKQLGTGHAVKQAEQYFKDSSGYVLVMYGDTPLVTSDTLSRTIEYHKNGNYAATVITAEMEDPTGYGRIIRDADRNIMHIVEHRDATSQEKAINEINSGMYLFSAGKLSEALKEMNNCNDQGEYYLTDIIGILIGKGQKVGAFKTGNSDEIRGINDRVQLQQASDILRKKVLTGLMLSGVSIIDPGSTFIDAGVEIGMDTIIYPGTIIEGGTKIGDDCVIGPNSRLVNIQTGNNVKINSSIALDSIIGNDAQIGPFAYIRPESRIGNKVKIGDFVEVKKSVIGERTKISHLAYIGDAEIGENTNIACGVITSNYDGRKKSRTVIGSNAFVGSNVNLIAPVIVNDNSYIAAGSTITEEVPENALAIARCRQENKEGWVIKKGMQRK